MKDTEVLYQPPQFNDNSIFFKISGLKKCKFWLGVPDPQGWAPNPEWSGVHCWGAPNGEKMVSIPAAILEIIKFEQNNLAPLSGQIGRGVAQTCARRLGAYVHTIAESKADITDRTKSPLKKVKFWLGTLTPKFGDPTPYARDLTPKEWSRYLQPLRRYWQSKIKIWRPLAAKPKVGGARIRACEVGSPEPIISESFVDLSPTVPPLGDLVNITIWPYTKNARFRYRRIRSYVLARTRQNSDDGVGKNSSTSLMEEQK